ncbi:carboxy-S-adenosyl-L-methionine synthase CmoA [Haliea sp. E17]|uniref:carboxy-S-adenosyl-L-methionine synthase CmoA n=1 Tax=Haliea sp. E17 TaxID=3401576 RepID=UPI003AAAC9A2
MSDSRDTIYANPLQTAGLFSFDARVAEVFPDMIQRSVPGYTNIVAMTGLLAQRFATPGSNLYDLGCSLGASSLAMRRNIDSDDCRIIGVDNSPAMLARCREIVDADDTATPVELLCADLADVAIENASVVVLNFTLQFVPQGQRNAVIERIYQGLRPGGILVLSEKVVFENPHLDALNIELHHEFKRANGYSDLEIAQKRAALENVLVPESLAHHKQRMQGAGFGACDVWFQCFNFASMIALK